MEKENYGGNRLTQVHLEKWPLKRSVCVCLYTAGNTCMQAERAFSELRRLEPHRTEGLDIYSTVLWHLQSEVALSTLAQDITEFDRLSPQV